MIHILLTLAGSLLVAVTLPLVIELFIVTVANLLPRAKLPTLDAAPASTDSSTKLAIIVPAHNEELLVSTSVASLLASARGGARVIVVAHNCVDSTADRARAAGAEVLVYNDAEAKGKGFALRHGFQNALENGAGAVLVVDADSVVTPNTVELVLKAFSAGARVVQCRYEMESTTDRASTRLAALAFRGFNVVRPRGRERLGFSCGILGNGFGILRPVLEAVPYDAFSVVEDLEYHLHLVMAGERVRYLDTAVISADFPESRVGESVQRSRWEGGRLLTARTWSLPLLGNVFRGSLRLLEPFCDLTGLPLAYGVFALLMTAAVPLHWTRWYAGLALTIVAVHVLVAAWAGPQFWKTVQLLCLSPVYILRKLWMIPGVLRGSSAKADWVRTERNNTL